MAAMFSLQGDEERRELRDAEDFEAAVREVLERRTIGEIALGGEDVGLVEDRLRSAARPLGVEIDVRVRETLLSFRLPGISPDVWDPQPPPDERSAGAADADEGWTTLGGDSPDDWDPRDERRE